MVIVGAVPAVLAVLVITVIIVAVVAWLVEMAREMRNEGFGQSREGFSIGNLFKKVSGAVVGAGKKVGAVGKGIFVGQKEVPTYVGRAWDGQDWSCPDNTIDTGKENSEACLTSTYAKEQWRWNGTAWAWSCPNGTVPTGQADGNKKCEVGYQARVLMDGKWQCPAGTTDTGANWENSDWAGAQKQCRRTTAYGQRMWDGKKWACPPGTTDTKRQWGQPGGGNQCRFTSG